MNPGKLAAMGKFPVKIQKTPNSQKSSTDRDYPVCSGISPELEEHAFLQPDLHSVRAGLTSISETHTYPVCIDEERYFY